MRARAMRTSLNLLLIFTALVSIGSWNSAAAQPVRQMYMRSKWDYLLRPFLEYEDDISLYIAHEGNGGPGQQSYSRFGGTQHMFFLPDGVFSMNAEGFVTTDGHGGVTTLLHTRQLIGQGLIGTGVSYTAQESLTDQIFQQGSVHVEIFPTNNWSVRANGYVPIGANDRVISSTTPMAMAAEFSGNNLIVPTETTIITESALEGVEFEIARKLGGMAAEAFGGYYKFRAPAGSNAEGGKFGVRAYITDRLQGHFAISKDDRFDLQAFGGVVWNLGGGAGLAPDTIRDKLTIPVERNHQLVMTQATNVVQGSVLVTDGGNAITVTHAQIGAAGTNSGTFENPFNTNMLPGTQPTEIVYVHSAFGSYLNGYTLAPGQRLLGEGAGNTHMINTDQFGPVLLPDGSGGFTRPAIQGTVVAANDTHISNVRLEPGLLSNGVELNNLVGPVMMDRSTITGGLAAISITDGTGDFTFAEVDITDPLIGVLLTGGSSNVTFGTVQPDVEFGPSSISQSGPGAVLGIGNHTGTFLLNAGNTITATGGPGVQFSNADGTYTFDGDMTLGGGDAVVDIINGSDGTFTFVNTDITSPSAPALRIGNSGIANSGGMAEVTFGVDSSITQASNNAAVQVLGDHNGSLTFDGTINATNGTGLQFGEMATGANGTYDFNGEVTLNGGDAGIDILGNSSGTFTFADTTITSPTGTSFNIQGNGPGDLSTASVNYTGGSIVHTSNTAAFNVIDHSTGSVVVNANVTTTDGTGLQFSNADGVYTFDGALQLNGGDSGIDIVGGSDGTFSFRQPTITNTVGTGVNIVGGTAQTTLNGGSITTTGGTGLNVENTGLTTIQPSTDITTTNGIGVNILNTQVDMTLRNIIVDGTPAEAIRIDTAAAGSNFTVTGVSRIINATTDGILLTNSQGTYTFSNSDIDGTGATGISLVNNPAATSVTITGGTIDGTATSGVSVNNTNDVTINGILFGQATPIGGNGISYVSTLGAPTNLTITNNLSFSTPAIAGRGIDIVANGAPGAGVNAVVTNNILASTDQTFVTTENGNTAALILQIDDNIWSTGSISFASDITGTAADSTIVTSLDNNATSGGGMLFNRVTFDSSGASLFGTQALGTGTTTITGGGDGLSLIDPMGDLSLTDVSITTFGGTGLEVFDTGLSTGFNLIVGPGGLVPSGSISSNGARAIYVDWTAPNMLTGSIGVGTVTSNNSSGLLGAPIADASGDVGDGLFINNLSDPPGAEDRSLIINSLNVTSAARHGVRIQNSQGQFDLATVAIADTALDAVSLVDNDDAATRVTINGGTIRDTPAMVDAINSQNTALTVNNVTLGLDPVDMSDVRQIRGDGIQILQTDNVNRLYVINGVNSQLSEDTVDIFGRAIVIETGMAGTGTINASIIGNNLQSQDTALFVRTNGNPNTDIISLNVSSNTWQTVPMMMAPPALTIDLLGTNLSPDSNTLRVTGFSDNTITGNAMGGGVRAENATFRTTALGNVGGGATIIGDGASVVGNGLALVNVSGGLNFADLDITNDGVAGPAGNVGLLVDTKMAGTNFFLGTADGTIMTTNGPAMFLDPLDVDLTFEQVMSSTSMGGPTAASAGDGVYLENVTGSLSISQLSVQSADGDGLHIVQNAGTGILNVTIDLMDISTTANHGIFIQDAAGGISTRVLIGLRDMDNMLTEGTISGTGLDGININGADSFVINGVTFSGITGFTGTLMDSSVDGELNVDDMFNAGPSMNVIGTIEFNNGMDILP